MVIPVVTALGRIARQRRIFTARLDSLDRVQHRINGKRVSASVYLREQRRGPGGRFGSKQQHISELTKKGVASQLMTEIGPPIGGGNWVSRVLKSKERFMDMLANGNQLG